MWTGVCRKKPATLGSIAQTVDLWCAKHSSSIRCAWNQIQLIFICRMLCISCIPALGEKGIKFAKRPLFCCRTKQGFLFLGCTQWVLSVLSQSFSSQCPKPKHGYSQNTIWSQQHSIIKLFSHCEGGKGRGIWIHFVGGEFSQCLCAKGGNLFRC